MSSMPLFWNLKVDRQATIQANLMVFQWENYGEKLEILNSPILLADAVTYSVELENLKEIDILLRQTRRHFKGADVDH